MILAEHFNLSIDKLMNDGSPYIPFRTAFISGKEAGFTDYLDGLAAGLERIAQDPDATIIYAGEDLPVFYSMMYPHLAHFKMSYWIKSILNSEHAQDTHLENLPLDEEWKEKARQISQLFSRVKSIELWNYDTIKSTFEQLRYYVESGHIAEKSTAMNILSDMKKLIERLHIQATKGQKLLPNGDDFGAAGFELFLSDLMIGNNCVQVISKAGTTSYIGYNTFKYLYSEDPTFNGEVSQWLDVLLSKSYAISKVGEKERRKFIQNMRKRCDELELWIEQQ